MKWHNDNEEHSIGSAHERKAVKALEWWAWALPIEFIELSESIAYGYCIAFCLWMEWSVWAEQVRNEGAVRLLRSPQPVPGCCRRSSDTMTSSEDKDLARSWSGPVNAPWTVKDAVMRCPEKGSVRQRRVR